ncbi:polyprenyl synthetase family protein [Paramicrobacterium chengjingii]|uniref:Polyprenyl synthetase family protein n=1 Tax=Paramicrobacterium chengjingii TaxID=2769067 RepID=A0ABX6YMR8_9MICO|nr:polyprenyl synthetase family protein [Microbacterium chengjingii]QPZ40123.1 polyprenyl synthetase family protein [Microbacterium chengjingii]
MMMSPAMRRVVSEIDEGLVEIERQLIGDLEFTDSVADASGRYLLEAGGKRVRPMLILLAAQLGDGNTQDVYDAAKAIEITHLASLYHDDVMDHADRRRGVPSAHTVWGNSVAILTGDLLFARASQLMANLGEKAIRLQADTFERLVLGQLHETVGPENGEDEEKHYIQVLADKTGSLISTAARAGALFANAPGDVQGPLREYGEKIGVAFQLVDDVIDLSPQPEQTGKVPGTDLRQGVATLPMIYLRQSAQTDAADADLVRRIDAESGDLDTATSESFANAVGELYAHPVTERTRAEAKKWAAEAIAALDGLPDGPVREALNRFGRKLADRDK